MMRLQKSRQNLISLRGGIHHWFDGLFCRRLPDIERLGQTSGWHIKTSVIGSDSIVYCAGVGQDVTFEMELSDRFGCAISLFDPSPTGIETMSLAENQSKSICFYPLGLAGQSGQIEFGEPIIPGEGSFSVAAKNTRRIQFECTSVGDFMRKHHHDHLDLLKMDIEGSEYGVIDSILREQLPVRMICCEFHHFLPGYSRLTTLRYVLKLRRHGYRLIHKDHHDYTFFRS